MLEQMAAYDWQFNGCSGDLVSANNPATITMNSDKAVTATFSNKVYSTCTASTAFVGAQP